MIRGHLGITISAGLTAAVLFVVFMVGCKDREDGVLGVCDNTPPVVSLVIPNCGATGVTLNSKINVTFSEPMDSSTVTTATFTLTGSGGAPVSGTVTYVRATNIATFTPASSLAASTTYTYVIKGGTNGVKDLMGNALVNNNGCTFTTGVAPDITPPTVISTNPANNATGVSLSKVSPTGFAQSVIRAVLNKINGTASGKVITATFSEAMDPLTITSSTMTVTGPGVTPVTGLVTYAGPSFAATFIAVNTLVPNTVYTGTITTGAKDLAGNALASNYVWSFTTGAAPDITPPTVASTDPANNAIGVALNKNIAVTFSEAMNQSTLNATTLTLKQGSTSVLGTVTNTSTTATFTPASSLAANTTYTATISTGAKDTAGNALASSYVWTFTTGAAPDITPPAVISTNPANNATGVPLSKVTPGGSTRNGSGAKLTKTSGTAAGKIITATFSEAMDPLTIISSTFTVTGPGVTPVAGLVTYAGASFTATFVATNTLAPNTTYTGTITTAAKDLAGNALASNYVWTFTTGAPADITPPTVISTDPVNNATGVAPNKKIVATFSEPMNQSTLSATTFTLKQGTTSVLGTVTNTSTTATFTPASSLTANTAYTATMSTAAMDTTGNALTTNYVWNFTTGTTADVTPPTVISTDPANNATGVALNKKIAAIFSEVMDPSTITSGFTLRQGATSIPGAVTYAGTTANFTPSGNLTANTVYTATISTGVKDLAGNALTNNYVWTFTTATAADVIPPTVLSTDPANTATGVALNKIVTAIFSEAMDQSTISTATVSLTGLGGAAVTGTVSYANGANTVTFTPASAFAANTTYTGTIKGGITGTKDLAGNALASNYVWNFTTGAGSGPVGQASVNLGSSARFAILSNSAITNIPTSAITGDVGISPGARSSITGLTLPEVTGTIFAADDAIPTPAMLIAAKNDAQAAYLDAVAAVRGTPTPISGNINGLTLVPGLYESGTSLQISPGGFLYLDAQGNSNAVFVIRSATSITTQSTSEVVLTNGAQAANVYWSAGSAVTLGTNSKMKGTIIASTSISLLTGARLDGRALIQGPAAGQVSLDHSIIVLP
jgi:methionine-rich copper-binding protein CopC